MTTRTEVAWLRVGALTLADLVALVGFRPHPAALIDAMASPNAWIARNGVDRWLGQVAGAALWLVGAWLAVGLLAAAAGCLPGAAGRIGRRAATVALPSAARRAIGLALGTGLVLVPVTSFAATPAIAQSATSTMGGLLAADTAAADADADAGSDHPLPPPVWPTADQADPSTSRAHAAISPPIWPTSESARHSARRPHHRLPSPTWPTSAPARAATSKPNRPTSSSTRPHASAHATPAPSQHPPSFAGDGDGSSATSRSSSGPAAETVTVRAGDSLWLLAARRLGSDAGAAQIAQTWPRWYAADRDVIGDDPALIVPGQVLHAPGPQSEKGSP